MKRVIVYVDGFNLYHAIDDLRDPVLKWLDLRALAESFLRTGKVLTRVNYYSVFATWRSDAYAKHRIYVAALKARGVDVMMGQFKKKDRSCRTCGAVWTAHEEKEADVHIAVQIVRAGHPAQDGAIPPGWQQRQRGDLRLFDGVLRLNERSV